MPKSATEVKSALARWSPAELRANLHQPSAAAEPKVVADAKSLVSCVGLFFLFITGKEQAASVVSVRTVALLGEQPVGFKL